MIATSNNILLSVVVPVYNVAGYLSKCLDSLSKLKSDRLEFVVVDDGSTDSSGTICDEYAAHDSRFKVFHKKNGGVSSARNLGLDNISGGVFNVC